MTRRGQKFGADKKRHDHQTVGVKIPVDNRQRGARMIAQDGGIERQPREGGDEQTDPDPAQTRMRNTLEKPEKRRPFQSPADGDPLALKLDGKNQGNEKQSHAAEPGQLRQTGWRAGCWSFPGDEEAGQRGECKGGGQQSHAAVGINGGNVLVNQEELHRSGHRRGGPRGSFSGKLARKQKRKQRENNKKYQVPEED